MFENARTEKRRGDPDRVQRQDKGKVKGGNGGFDQGRGSRLLITPRTDKGNRALMLSGFGIEMQQFVPAR